MGEVMDAVPALGTLAPGQVHHFGGEESQLGIIFYFYQFITSHK